MISTTKLSNFKKNQLPSKLLTYNPFNNSLLLYDGTFINSYSSINHKLIISTVFKTNDSLADIISASYSHLLNLYFLLTSDGILHILSSITHQRIQRFQTHQWKKTTILFIEAFNKIIFNTQHQILEIQLSISNNSQPSIFNKFKISEVKELQHQYSNHIICKINNEIRPLLIINQDEIIKLIDLGQNLQISQLELNFQPIDFQISQYWNYFIALGIEQIAFVSFKKSQNKDMPQFQNKLIKYIPNIHQLISICLNGNKQQIASIDEQGNFKLFDKKFNLLLNLELQTKDNKLLSISLIQGKQKNQVAITSVASDQYEINTIFEFESEIISFSKLINENQLKNESLIALSTMETLYILKINGDQSTKIKFSIPRIIKVQFVNEDIIICESEDKNFIFDFKKQQEIATIRNEYFLHFGFLIQYDEDKITINDKQFKVKLPYYIRDIKILLKNEDKLELLFLEEKVYLLKIENLEGDYICDIQCFGIQEQIQQMFIFENLIILTEFTLLSVYSYKEGVLTLLNLNNNDNHSQKIIHVDYNKEKEIILSCSEDQTIKLWTIQKCLIITIQHYHLKFSIFDHQSILIFDRTNLQKLTLVDLKSAKLHENSLIYINTQMNNTQETRVSTYQEYIHSVNLQQKIKAINYHLTMPTQVKYQLLPKQNQTTSIFNSFTINSQNNRKNNQNQRNITLNSTSPQKELFNNYRIRTSENNKNDYPKLMKKGLQLKKFRAQSNSINPREKKIFDQTRKSNPSRQHRKDKHHEECNEFFMSQLQFRNRRIKSTIEKVQMEMKWLPQVQRQKKKLPLLSQLY